MVVSVESSPELRVRTRKIRQSWHVGSAFQATQPTGWSRSRLESGYVDQSHIHREVRGFAGLTPAAVAGAPWLAIDMWRGRRPHQPGVL